VGVAVASAETGAANAAAAVAVLAATVRVADIAETTKIINTKDAKMTPGSLKANLVCLAFSLCSLCFSFCNAKNACAWDDGGHMLVAQIAYSQMNSAAKLRANALLEYLPDVRRSSSRAAPRPYDFVTAACWMDDIKSSSQYDAYRKLHYIDVPCGGDPGQVAAPNALTAIASSRSTLMATRGQNEERAIALATLMHVVGDIHQPLHCIDRDLGGNTFAILGVPGLDARLRRDGKSVDRTRPATGENAPVYQRLHAFWDIAYRYDVVDHNHHKSVEVLYSPGHSSQPDLARIKRVANDLTVHYLPVETRVLAVQSVAAWITEGNRQACTRAFSTPRGQRPSDAYFAKSHDAACRRIALAGYRLAKLLNAVLSSSL
jgi:hypothetical protein